MRIIILLCLAAFLAGFMYEASASDTRLCCNSYGQCVIVKKYAFCPAGYDW